MASTGGTGKSALFAAGFLVGVLLAVYGQVYQTGADPFGLFLAWAVLILGWALVGRQVGLWMLLLVLLNLTLILYWTQVVEPQGLNLLGIAGPLAGLSVTFVDATLVALVFTFNALALVLWEVLAGRGIVWMGGRTFPRVVSLLALAPVVSSGLILIVASSFGEVDGWNVLGLLLFVGFAAASLFYFRVRVHDLFILTRLPAGEHSALHEPRGSAGRLRHGVLVRAGGAGRGPDGRGGILAAKRSTGVGGVKMSGSRATIGEVFDTLVGEGLAEDSWAVRALAEADLSPPQPWYVRAMVGFGAWLGSLFLLGAVVGASVATTGGGFITLGLVFIVLAWVVRKTTDNDFTRQATLATSLAGQLLLAGGVAQEASSSEIEAFFTTLILTNAVLVAVVADRTHRFLSVVIIVTSVVSLVYLHEAQTVVPVLAPLLAASVVVLLWAEPTIVASGLDELLIPVTAGILVSALGCTMLSTLYVLPELMDDFVFYPRPWISTLLFGALLLYAERDVWSGMFGSPDGRGASGAYGVTLILIVTSLPAPGLILALLVMVLGLVHGSRPYTGTGVVFLALFLGTYFYGIDLSMLAKSATLVATGGAVLLARRVLLALSEGLAGTGATEASPAGQAPPTASDRDA